MSETEQAITPAGMLHDFREHSDPWLIEQSRLFGLMAPAAQRELLFWMIMNNGIAMENLRGVLLNAAGQPAPATAN